MLRTRLWTALAVLPAVLALVIFSGARVFACFIGILAAWGLFEIGSICTRGRPALIALLGLSGGLPALGLLGWRAFGWWLPALVIGAMLALTAGVALKEREFPANPALLTLLGALWVGALFPYFALLRNQPGGSAMMILMLALVIASDSAAYFAGLHLGRLKLLPRLSPNKTVEGAAAALASSLLAGALLGPVLTPSLGVARLLLWSAAVNLLAQAGDLAGSALKRSAKVKDFGWVFPGHGGLLDRTSSLVFAAAFTYYYFR